MIPTRNLKVTMDCDYNSSANMEENGEYNSIMEHYVFVWRQTTYLTDSY
jgi:hypothetical protein